MTTTTPGPDSAVEADDAAEAGTETVAGPEAEAASPDIAEAAAGTEAAAEVPELPDLRPGRAIFEELLSGTGADAMFTGPQPAAPVLPDWPDIFSAFADDYARWEPQVAACINEGHGEMAARHHRAWYGREIGEIPPYEPAHARGE